MAGTVFNKYSGAGEMKANKCRIQPQPTQPSSCRFCIQKKKVYFLHLPHAARPAGPPQNRAPPPRAGCAAPRAGCGRAAPPLPPGPALPAPLRASEGVLPPQPAFLPLSFRSCLVFCRFLRVYSFNSSLCSVGSRASLRTALRGSLSFIRVYFCPKT